MSLSRPPNRWTALRQHADNFAKVDLIRINAVSVSRKLHSPEQIEVMRVLTQRGAPGSFAPEVPAEAGCQAIS